MIKTEFENIIFFILHRTLNIKQFGILTLYNYCINFNNFSFKILT
ncbi:MAG: hypothetical protein CFH32_00718 [Alphaproteobacteria bacterium MarineAlpha9_Bin2]|nr:MAG: hypothetical protein CFH32_00718 [Alphaproteobacteria bacterium MarineAlpha9_Bin2]